MTWCHCFCLFWYFLVHTFGPSHSYNSFIRRHSPSFLSISSLLVSSVGKTSPECRAGNRTRACLKHYHLNYLATFWATSHPNWATSHPTWATTHPYYQTCLNINQGNQNSRLLGHIDPAWTQGIHFLHSFYTSLLAARAENMLSAVSTAAGGQISQAWLEHMMRIIHSEIRQCVGIWHSQGIETYFDPNVYVSPLTRVSPMKWYECNS